MFIQVFDRALQWRDVDLDISFQDLSQIQWVVSALAGNLNTLDSERFSFNLWDTGSAVGNDFVTHAAFSRVPNLRQVYLSALRFDNIILPWSQLTSLTITGGFCVEDCMQVLQLLPCLTSCQLDNITGELDSLALISPLPNLQSLHLDCLYSLHMLRVLTLPGLLWYDEDDHVDQYVVPFLSRSPVRLCKFFLRRSWDFLSEALPLIPALADIEIGNLAPDDATAFLKNLCDFVATAIYVQSIGIRVIDFEDVANPLDYHVLVATLIALKAHVLQSFRLIWDPNQDLEDRS
ncbi:hypothetical protein C8R44DRAFT_981319 [Mycena epipterygia]|nr:hypothetical protein C8R44DRAFT_981319 [Mycena epipterygia]